MVKGYEAMFEQVLAFDPDVVVYAMVLNDAADLIEPRIFVRGNPAVFLREHGVEAVAAHHMGAGMTHMLEKMGLTVRLGETGSAREAAARVLGGERDTGRHSTPH